MKHDVFENFMSALQRLREEGVLINQRDFTSQLGEWLIAQLYNGVRAERGNQPNWDILTTDGQHLQVKSHAKASTTNAKWTRINYPLEGIDFLVIVVFTPNYKLQNLFYVPANKIGTSIPLAENNRILKWSLLTDFKVKSLQLNNHLLLKYFDYAL